ncbi:MAG: hypothetical protein ACYDBQ_08120 [Thermoplasmatota archaeon]
MLRASAAWFRWTRPLLAVGTAVLAADLLVAVAVFSFVPYKYTAYNYEVRTQTSGIAMAACWMGLTLLAIGLATFWRVRTPPPRWLWEAAIAVCVAAADFVPAVSLVPALGLDPSFAVLAGMPLGLGFGATLFGAAFLLRRRSVAPAPPSAQSPPTDDLAVGSAFGRPPEGPPALAGGRPWAAWPLSIGVALIAASALYYVAASSFLNYQASGTYAYQDLADEGGPVVAWIGLELALLGLAAAWARRAPPPMWLRPLAAASCVFAVGLILGNMAFLWLGNPGLDASFPFIVGVAGALASGVALFVAAHRLRRRSGGIMTGAGRGLGVGIVIGLLVGTAVGADIDYSGSRGHAHVSVDNSEGMGRVDVAMEVRDRVGAGNATTGTLRCAVEVAVAPGRFVELRCPTVQDGPYLVLLATNSSRLAKRLFFDEGHDFMASVDARGNITLNVAFPD